MLLDVFLMIFSVVCFLCSRVDATAEGYQVGAAFRSFGGMLLWTFLVSMLTVELVSLAADLAGLLG